MDALKKIKDDWSRHQHAKTRAIADRPWGWQWGGGLVFKQVADLNIGKFLHSPVLDIGCGGGKWEKWLIDNYSVSITGADVHNEAITESQEYEPRASYVLINGEDLSQFDAGSFGTVFIFDTLLHFR